MSDTANRITARKFLLINWSMFQYVTFEMSGSTLITGVNGTGKSTILDAMTYLLCGNNKFNIAAQDKDRSIRTYVRGDTSSVGPDRYLRSGQISSYIAMEFYNPLENRPLVCGVSIESISNADPTDSKWFVFPDTALSDVGWREPGASAGKMKVVPRNSLTVKGVRPKGAAFMNRKTGVPQVLRALGLRTDADLYKSKLIHMISFQAETDVEGFIQQSVLEEDPVGSLAEIKAYRSQYSELKNQYDDMLEQRKQLEIIESDADEYERRLRNLQVQELMLSYQGWKSAQAARTSLENNVELLTQQQSALEGGLPDLQHRLDAALARRTRAENNEILSDVNASLSALNFQKEGLKRDLSEAEKAAEALQQLEKGISETFSWEGRSVSVPAEEKNVLTRLSDPETPAAKKLAAFQAYKQAAEAARDAFSDEDYHLKDALKEAEEKRRLLYVDRKRLESNRMIYDPSAEAARDCIAGELKKAGIETDVYLFAELVKDLKDSSWRRAIETFLGNKRFNIIVEPKYVGEALRILDEKNLYKARVVMTDRLPVSLDAAAEGSAAGQLVISNAAARRYANYLLGGIALCDTLDDLHDHPLGGLMKNGMLAKSYAVTKMDLKKVRVCLGRDALELQLADVNKQIEAVEEGIGDLSKQEAPVGNAVKYLQSLRLDPEAFRFDAPERVGTLTKDIAGIEADIRRIQDNPDLAAALEEQTRARDEYNQVLGAFTKQQNSIQACRTKIEDGTRELAEKQEVEKRAGAAFEEHVSELPELKADMLSEYERLTKRSGNLIAIQPATVDRNRTELSGNYERLLREDQQKYLRITGRMDEYEIRVGAGCIPWYRDQYRSLKNVRIDETRELLEQKMQQLESAFMNDFVAELKEKMDRAAGEIEGINRELKETPFGQDTYRFEMKPRSDRTAFFNIARRLDDYKNQMGMMLAMENGNTDLDRDIQDFVSVILSDENEEEYTDYRRYFNYDMRIISNKGDTYTEAELSRKQGSASGGEKQTPYFIILAASLLQCYPRESCCERLAFIDEAFAVLSRERVEQMVKYLEANHFQVIYAAPPDKIESIGSHIDTTVSLVTKGRYSFAIDGLKL